MMNALATGPSDTQNSRAQPGAPDGNALASGGGAPMPAPGMASPANGLVPPQPAPTHEQTVAALRHFSALETELESLAANPDLGRSSVKSAIIDGTTKLVASRIMSPSQAVQQLGTVPDDPKEQRKWVQGHLQQIEVAKDAVLAHHAAAFPSSQNYAIERLKHGRANPDAHMQTMASLHSLYGKR